MPEYECAICSCQVHYEGRTPALYPFCSSRCRLVDLGHWFHGDYSIDQDLTPPGIGPEAVPPGDPDEEPPPE